jgi:translation initiation factor 3 subunit H
LLKIIKHCKENVPELVMGQLLGLDVDNTLEVTHSFPLLNDADEETEHTYGHEMIKALRATNIDPNNVGWYKTAYLADIDTSELVQAQLSYQLEIPNSVVVIFDPFKTQKGRLSITALRLSNKFMELNATGKFTPKQLKEYGLDFKTIFDELPIKIYNDHLVHAYLYELRESKITDCTADRLNVAAGPIIEKLVDMMSSSGGALDDYTTELERYKNATHIVSKQRADYQKRLEQTTEENERRKKIGLQGMPLPDDSAVSKLEDPSRLEAVLHTAVIDSYCNDVVTLSSQAYQKQCVLKALMRGETEAEEAGDAEDKE